MPCQMPDMIQKQSAQHKNSTPNVYFSAVEFKSNSKITHEVIQSIKPMYIFCMLKASRSKVFSHGKVSTLLNHLFLHIQRQNKKTKNLSTSDLILK